jgi:hypothetical protein
MPLNSSISAEVTVLTVPPANRCGGALSRLNLKELGLVEFEDDLLTEVLVGIVAALAGKA